MDYIEMTEDEFVDLDNSYIGICLNCGERAWGVEPDARNYTCESCDAAEVYGAAELLIMGRIEFI